MSEDKPKLKGPFLPEIRDTLIAKTVALALKGHNLKQISDDLGITRNAVRRFLKSPKAKEIYAEVEESIRDVTKTQIRVGVAEMRNDALKSLHGLIKDKNPQALKMFFQMIGTLEPEQNTGLESGLVVNLQLGKADKDKVVDAEVKKAGDKK